MPHYTEADQYHAAIESGVIDVSAHGQQSVFWSAYRDGNKNRAEQYCHSETAVGAPSTTLEQTSGGRFLDNEALFSSLEVNDSVAQAVWDKASERYAQDASGDCKAFVIKSDPTSTFRRVELPELLQNEGVDSINGVSREQLKDLHAKDNDAAFNQICEAELDRDRDRAGATPDFQYRKALYREQLTTQGRDPDKPGEATRPMSKDERDVRRQAAARQKELEHETAMGEPQRDDREVDRSQTP